jgi:hypothetical protein
LVAEVDAKDLQIGKLAAATSLLKESHATTVRELAAKHASELVRATDPNARFVEEMDMLRTQLACLLPEVRLAEHERRLHEIESEEVR